VRNLNSCAFGLRTINWNPPSMAKKSFSLAAVALAAALAASPSGAQKATDTTATVRASVEKALASNPEVAARLHAFRAANDFVDVAASARGPRLDLTGDVGIERGTFRGGVPNSSLNRGGLGLNLTQVLWDGLGTRNEIERAGHERMSRYFELLDVTEQTALEAARAHYDVQRFRKLVALAEDNYVQHRQAAEKIGSRVKAGVGRGVDLEQANARLALAESNLSTEVSNLHDVSARYQRIVGELPPKDAGALATMDSGLPLNAAAALKTALARNPGISASVESVRAARAATKTRQSQLQPRVEARVRTGVGHNYNGLDGRRSDSAAEITLNWNLFDGGADKARVRQQANQVNQALDLRDKACRDARQTTLIAYNDTLKLADQLMFLERNTQAIERARDAYLQQFDIGQRSLLDLLNAENEAYTARRAMANAQYDHAVAYVRTHAALNQLNAQLGIARAGQVDEAAGWSAGADAAGRCPAQTVELAEIDTVSLLARVQAGTTAATDAAPMSAPQGTPAIAAAPIATAVTALDAPAMPPAMLKEILNKRVDAWAAAWRSKDFARYASFYAPGFSGREKSASAWSAKRSAMLAKPGAIGVDVSGIDVLQLGDGQAITRFKQAYTSTNYRDVGDKVLTWKLVDKQWLIVKESNR
jgi:adhesin transport system outer membrane protein